MSYNPRDVPSTINQLPQFIQDELWSIAKAIAADDSYTADQLKDKESSINKKLKGTGVRVWDSTNKKPIWSTGNAPTDSWVDGVGVVAHIPV